MPAKRALLAQFNMECAPATALFDTPLAKTALVTTSVQHIHDVRQAKVAVLVEGDGNIHVPVGELRTIAQVSGSHTDANRILTAYELRLTFRLEGLDFDELRTVVTENHKCATSGNLILRPAKTECSRNGSGLNSASRETKLLRCCVLVQQFFRPVSVCNVRLAVHPIQCFGDFAVDVLSLLLIFLELRALLRCKQLLLRLLAPCVNDQRRITDNSDFGGFLNNGLDADNSSFFLSHFSSLFFCLFAQMRLQSHLRFVFGILLDFQNLTDALDNLLRLSLATKNLVEVRIIKEQSSIALNRLNQLRLLHTSLQQLHLHFQLKARTEVFFQNSTSICQNLLTSTENCTNIRV
nr:MAG TPA: hypothetical protein [Caudoviricetes sp.]